MENESELKALREEIAALRRDVARLEGVIFANRNVAAPALPTWPAYRPTLLPLMPNPGYAPPTWYSTSVTVHPDTAYLYGDGGSEI